MQQLRKKIPDATTLIYVNQYNTDNEVMQLRKLSDVVAQKKIPDVTTLIYVNQYNTDKRQCWQKIPVTSSLVTATVLNTKISEFEKQIRVVQ